jgi:SAM-dependent methyltransferase
MTETSEHLNREVFDSDSVIAAYSAADELLAPERAVLDRIGPWLRDRAALDLGVGTGRTTAAIAPLCRRYVGLDYAPGMVARCRERFPGHEIRQGDAGDLSDYTDGSFGFVLFSYNGIDYSDAEGRACVLAEVRRVLAPDGLFLFSSHNLHRPPEAPRLFADFTWSNNPLRLAKRAFGSIRYGLRHVTNYRANRGRQCRGDGEAWLVDAAHDYRLLTCYVTPEAQQKRLAEKGLRLHAVLDEDGAPCVRPRGRWVHFVAGRERSEYAPE